MWAGRQSSVSTLAHELRQPLANLSCAAEIVRAAPASAAALQAIAVIQRQVHQMTRMVEDLLDEARCARGALSLRMTPLDLRTTVQHAVWDVRARMAQHGHQLVVAVGDESLWVDADPDRLRQVLSNLIDNAIKYTEPGGRIQITARRSGGYAVLRVEDTGRGLEPSQLTRIFELFAQDRPTENPGLGIGLTIVRDIVTRHGGEIEAHSDGAGRGAAFTVRLPRISAPTENGDAARLVSAPAEPYAGRPFAAGPA